MRPCHPYIESTDSLICMLDMAYVNCLLKLECKDKYETGVLHKRMNSVCDSDLHRTICMHIPGSPLDMCICLSHNHACVFLSLSSWLGASDTEDGTSVRGFIVYLWLIPSSEECRVMLGNLPLDKTSTGRPKLSSCVLFHSMLFPMHSSKVAAWWCNSCAAGGSCQYSTLPSPLGK